MKLLKFPFLVLNRIIITMGVTEAVTISFCSTKMKRIIKNTKCKWNVSYLRYRLQEQLVYVDFFYDKKRSDTLSLEFTHATQIETDTEIVQLKNSKLELRFVKPDLEIIGDPVESAVIHVLDSDDSRIELHKLLLEFFQTTPRVQLCTNAGTDLGLVPILENVTEFQLSGSEATSEYAEEYFSKFNDLQSVLVKPILKGPLTENSKLSSARKLLIEQTRDQFYFIKHFKGQVGSFKQCECNTNLVIELIKLWISNEAFQNLDYLSMNVYDTIRWSLDDVVQAIETSKWDPLKRPENYEKTHEILHWSINPMKCAEFLDVTREIDGKIASLNVQPMYFQFIVWN